MSTYIRSPFDPDFAATNLDRTFNYSEGETVIDFSGITFVTGNLRETITFTFEIVANGIESEIIIDSGISSSASFTRTADTYTLEGTDYNDVREHLDNFDVILSSDEFSQDFTFNISGTDGITSPQLGVTTFDGQDIPDAININQTNVIHEDRFGFTYAADGTGQPAVQDQLGPGSGRTYRVTYSPLTGGDEQYRIFSTKAGAIGADTVYSSTVFFEGDQTTVNSRMDDFYIDMGPDWNTDTTIVYTQEVLTGAPNTPYTQDIGYLVFSPITADIPGTVATTQTYDEDTPKAVTIATINDSRGTQDTNVTYNASITISNSLAGTINIGVFDAVDTYNLTNLSKEVLQSNFDNFVFAPSADYEDNLTFTIFVDREQQHGDPTWNPVNRQTLINNEIVDFNINTVHDEFALFTPQTYQLDTVSLFKPAEITDLAQNKTYTVDMTLSDPLAGTLEVQSPGWQTLPFTGNDNASCYIVAFKNDDAFFVVQKTFATSGSLYYYRLDGGIWSGSIFEGLNNVRAFGVSESGATTIVTIVSDPTEPDPIVIYSSVGSNVTWTKETFGMSYPVGANAETFGTTIDINPVSFRMAIGDGSLIGSASGAVYMYDRVGNSFVYDSSFKPAGTGDTFGQLVKWAFEDGIGGAINTLLISETQTNKMWSYYDTNQNTRSYDIDPSLVGYTNFGFDFDTSNNYLYALAEDGSSFKKVTLSDIIVDVTFGIDLSYKGLVGTQFSSAISTPYIGIYDGINDIIYSLDGGSGAIEPSAPGSLVYSEVPELQSPSVSLTVQVTSHNHYVGAEVNSGLIVYAATDSLVLYSSTAGIFVPFPITSTKGGINTSLESTRFTPALGYVQDVDLLYTQNQDTDNIDQGGGTVDLNFTP